ncbi:MAG: hypothetical protein K2X47_01850 [Bdellovibrionales bacterium]|nr:hypothetical protein [Bdellovibrionales bacterium]
MTETVPNFIVHYSRGEPFRSISEIPKEHLLEMLTKLDETNSWGLNRFLDSEYLPRRIKVEQRIRQEFMRKGGKPELLHPIYFFLGNHTGFEKNKRNVPYRINLNDLPPHVASFTYGDSMFSMCENYRQKLGHEYLSNLCAQVYRLEDLQTLHFAMRDLSPKLHIECQFWIRPHPEMFPAKSP